MAFDGKTICNIVDNESCKEQANDKGTYKEDDVRPAIGYHAKPAILRYTQVNYVEKDWSDSQEQVKGEKLASNIRQQKSKVKNDTIHNPNEVLRE